MSLRRRRAGGRCGLETRPECSEPAVLALAEGRGACGRLRIKRMQPFLSPEKEADHDGYHFRFSVYLQVEFCPCLLLDGVAAGICGVWQKGRAGSHCDAS